MGKDKLPICFRFLTNIILKMSTRKVQWDKGNTMGIVTLYVTINISLVINYWFV